MEKIIFMTNTLFPEGQAYSTRIMGFANLFNTLGYSVHVIADITKRKNIVRNQIYDFEYGTYEITGHHGHLNRMIWNKYSAIKALKRYIANNNVHAVVLNASSDRFNRILSICRDKKIKLILEICEWYDKTSFKLGSFDYRYYHMNQAMNKQYYKADGLIVISRFLKQHFIKKNRNVVIIPTIFDTQKLPYSSNCKNSKLILMHAGCPVIHKEKFKNIMLAIKKIAHYTPIEYRIYGSSLDIVLKNIDGDENLLKSLNDNVKIMGTIPHDEVNKAYQQADFSIFMRRERKRSTSAGFPTKLAESMAAGTPVIANDTGDIGLYLKNGYNGFLLNSNSVEEIEATLKKIVSLSLEQKQNMRENARTTAENYFDYRNYLKVIKDLLL